MNEEHHQSDLSVKEFEENIRNFFSNHDWASQTSVADLLKIFKPSCFYYTDSTAVNDKINQRLTEFSKAFIAGEDGDFNQFKLKLKSYDFSATCGLVWTTNYFAYRCRTCCLSPSMSLCSACFNNGNHVGHDFNKFKSQAGGACDCGNPYVMKEFGYCRHHGPGKLSQQREPPDSLINRFKLLIPIYLKAILVASWSLIKTADLSESPINMSSTSDILLPIMSFINELLACGWVTQRIIAGIMTDKTLFSNFINDYKHTDQYYIYDCALRSDPDFKFPEGKVGSQQLVHQTLVDAFMFFCVKLRFPENLITFLIGLLTIDSYKEIFVHSYLNHYSRMASTIFIHAKTVRNGQDASYNMNNRIVHISVQLFSGEVLALQMVKERDLHYLIVHCLLNMFGTALMRLDDNDTSIINCETPMIQNNVFWPLISDLTNLVTHKSVVDIFVADREFMNDWTNLLKWMQFMNFFVLKEGNHIEYETMAFFHAFTMEIEISTNSMWNIWNHYRNENEKENVLKLVKIFVSALSSFIGKLGTFQTIQPPHQTRVPLSFHLPLMRNVACYLSLGLIYHNLPLATMLENITMDQMVRWFKETANTLLGCQEVLIGYWVRNGQSVRTSTTYYIHNQFCYGLIDMDIFAAQVCVSVIPSSTVLFILTDPTQLLKDIKFSHKSKAKINHLKSHTQPRVFGLEKLPLALEAWFLNLCWILDLRNEINVDEGTKLRREVCSQLCPEPIKRSDLSHRLPERTGINMQISTDIDSVLKEVANFTAPTFDEYSGNLQSGLYLFKPELWDTDYDPIFQSLRSVSKRDAADALSKYREYYRQKMKTTHSNSLWPPYRKPPSPHAQLLPLENLLHCKDLTYIIFCSLNMFVNNDPIVTEDSLALIIHLIHRSLLIAEPQDVLEDMSDIHTTRFPTNPYKVNDMRRNIRYTVELHSDTNTTDDDQHKMTTEINCPQLERLDKDYTRCRYEIVQRESILSLLLKIHSKLHMLRLQAGGKSLLLAKSSKFLKISPTDEPMEMDDRSSVKVDIKSELGMSSSQNNNDSRQRSRLDIIDILSLDYFNNYPLVYEYSEDNLIKSKETGIGINWGDGVDFIGHLLDIIASKSDDNSNSLLELIVAIKYQNVDNIADGSERMDNASPECQVENTAESMGIINSVTEKKQKALDRRIKVIANMAMKQKSFASAHQHDLIDTLIKEENKEMYSCVICQLKSDPNKEKMVLLGIICSAGLLKYMKDVRETSGCDKVVTYRKDYMDKLFVNAPIRSHSMIIQTCGHVVHQECFDKYRAQRPAVTRMRRTITCPLCRRDVHHLTPIQTRDIILYSPYSFFSILKSLLLETLNTEFCDMQTNIIEESIAKHQVVNISIEHQACSLLRSQMELELIICVSVPDQYNAIIRRCIWPEFISYLRTLNANIKSLIRQSDSLFGTSFGDEVPLDKIDTSSKTNPLLFEVPTDILLNFIPYIWPYEDQFLNVLKACIVMAYIKGIVLIGTRLNGLEYAHWCQRSQEADEFQQQLVLVLERCGRICQRESMSTANQELYLTNIKSYDTIISDLAKSLLPLLRISAVLKLRLMKQNNVPTDFPIRTIDNVEYSDYGEEFIRLCDYLCLIKSTSSSKKCSEKLVNLLSISLRSTLFDDFNQALNTYISDEFIETFLIEKQNLRSNDSSLDILNIGNELYPPNLIQLPNSYDDLFNAHHSLPCNNNTKARVHNFPENGLCLICGTIVCLLCDSMPLAFYEHTKTCCFGMGLMIDVNSSIIHVLLNNEISQWGSVYLDYYGEEDLELKRGRPLSMDGCRFKLLEQQWLMHSFKHVLKTWRRIS